MMVRKILTSGVIFSGPALLSRLIAVCGSRVVKYLDTFTELCVSTTAEIFSVMPGLDRNVLVHLVVSDKRLL